MLSATIAQWVGKDRRIFSKPISLRLLNALMLYQVGNCNICSIVNLIRKLYLYLLNYLKIKYILK